MFVRRCRASRSIFAGRIERLGFSGSGIPKQASENFGTLVPSSFNGFTEDQNKKGKTNNMRTKIVSEVLLSVGLMLVLGSGLTQVHGQDVKPTVVTINSTEDVTREKPVHSSCP